MSTIVELDVIRFYNGQSGPFQQKFVYTKPDTDFKDEYGNAYWNVDAPPKKFFTVPFELEAVTGGVWRIGIHREITERFGERGIVRVDANAKRSIIAELEAQTESELQATIDREQVREFVLPDSTNQAVTINVLAEHMIMTAVDNRFAFIAFDDATAKIKGDRLWRAYLRRVIDDFEYENNRRVIERGQTPLRPNAFVGHAYKELGMEVPGDEKFIKAGVQQTDVGNLKTAVAQQAETINTQSEQIRVLLERLNQLAPPASSDVEQQQEAVGAAAGNGAGNGKDKTHKTK